MVRALESSYQTMALSKPSLEPNLKISVASSDDLGHARTLRMKRKNEKKNEMEEDDNIEEDLVVNEFQHKMRMESPMPDKLYFLATGEGCATVELETSHEMFEVENENSIYQVGLDVNQDESDLYLSVCLRYLKREIDFHSSLELSSYK